MTTITRIFHAAVFFLIFAFAAQAARALPPLADLGLTSQPAAQHAPRLVATLEQLDHLAERIIEKFQTNDEINAARGNW